MSKFGSRNDRQRFILTTSAPEQLYVKSPADTGDLNLTNVHAQLECLPHPLLWSRSTVVKPGQMFRRKYMHTVNTYLVNMVDDELDLVRDQLMYLYDTYTVHHIDCFDDAFHIHATVQGRKVLAVVNVFNKFKLYEEMPRGQQLDASIRHSHARWSLN